MEGLNKTFKEFDEAYEQYRDYVRREDWRNANDSRSYMTGMVRCMQLLYTEAMGESVYQEVVKRCKLGIGDTPVNG